jgi:hypothetical protein
MGREMEIGAAEIGAAAKFLRLMVVKMARHNQLTA